MEVEQKLLLEPEDVKPSFKGWQVSGVFNPGGVRLPNKKILLLARVAENSHQSEDPFMRCPVVVSSKQYRTLREKIHPKDVVGKDGNLIYLKNKTCRLKNFSHFRKVLVDKTGFKVEKVFEKPSFHGTGEEGQYGVEDPRITLLEGKYHMTYVTVNKLEGVCTNLAVSGNLRNWERRGIIFREQNKDVALFPEKIKGEYVALHRPEGFFEFSRPSIWISHSKDLVYWGREKSIVETREGCWDSERVGAGSVPLKTKEGWLEIYHGVYEKRRQKIYSAGAVLLDLEQPEVVLARTPKNRPLFRPEKRYERKGYINDVVFPTVTIPDLDGKSLLVYSGGSDTVVSVRKLLLQDILNSLKSVKS
jgi:predicted GH43/DUF377 family glycosyl hydrolase